MCYNRLSVFSTLAAVVLAAGLVTPVVLPWDDVRVKHAWNSIPDDWETLGPPPANTTIDLHVALKPRNENALIDALYEVSSPGHPKKVLSNTPQRTVYLRVLLIDLQIWGLPFQAGGRQSCRASPGHDRSCLLMDFTPRPSVLLSLNDARRKLVEAHRRARVTSQPTPQCIVPALPGIRDE